MGSTQLRERCREGAVNPRWKIVPRISRTGLTARTGHIRAIRKSWVLSKLLKSGVVGRMPQGNMVPRFARPAVLPSKEGAEGREIVE